MAMSTRTAILLSRVFVLVGITTVVSTTCTKTAFAFLQPSTSSSSRHEYRRHGVQGIDDDGHQKTPVVAIVGSGAVGGYYGSRLWECGKYDVHFHMRGEHLEISRKNGLQVTSIDGDIFIEPENLQTFTDPYELSREKDVEVDWVIVALKSHSLDDIPELIYPLLRPGKTRVLCIMNGLIDEDLVTALKKRSEEDPSSSSTITCCGAVYGGMALICSNRLEPGKIDHSYAGLLSSGVAARHPDLSSSDLQQDFEELFRPTSVPISYEKSILAGRWRKCLWNIPFNGISVAMGGLTVDKIVNDPGLRQLALDLMEETVGVANSDLKFHGLGNELFVGEDDKERMMLLSDTMGEYKTSTMLDFVNGRPMESKYLFRKPLERARDLGIPVPKLEVIVAMCEALDKGRSRTLEATDDNSEIRAEMYEAAS
mmetsp:Transcript_52271/g.126372  ORF Transcript_52271/g.126372 Transcript_52271/m.126372 type:complete len:426 (+) Transcript_52271:274-1551(+)